jgi:hypothetical protein
MHACTYARCTHVIVSPARRRSGLDSTGRGVAPAALNACSRSGRQPILAQARSARTHQTAPRARPRTRVHVAGGEGCKGSGAVPSSLETLGCGERGGTATKLTQMRTGTRVAATSMHRGGRRIGLFPARRPRRSCHTRALTSHRPHRSEFSPCRGHVGPTTC